MVPSTLTVRIEVALVDSRGQKTVTEHVWVGTPKAARHAISARARENFDADIRPALAAGADAIADIARRSIERQTSRAEAEAEAERGAVLPEPADWGICPR